MHQFTQRASFTTRLLALAASIMAVLVMILYVALLELPARIARDTVEIALRENVQSLNATFREDRLELVHDTDAFVSEAGVKSAIARRDATTLRDRLDANPDLGPDVQFKFIPAAEFDESGVGVITSPYVLPLRDGGQQPIVFYRLVTDEVLDRAASNAGGQVAFALEREDGFVARGGSFPARVKATDLDTSLDPNVAKVNEIDVGDDHLHLYSRALTSDQSFQLHALSTPRLEQSALSDIRGDVRTAIGAMMLAAFASVLLLVYFTNRSVRSFASRVRTLADGDFGTRLTVRGSDAFADLAGSVNRLSVQLEDQLGQLQDTAGAFRRTLETLEEGICVWNEAGELTYWNRGAEQLTGLARERAQSNETVVAFLHAERAPGARRITLPVRRSGGGLVCDLLVTAMPDGGVVQTFRDTSMTDMLQQTQRNFMATAAHELRTPITTILGFADTLANPELELSDPQRAEFLSIISEQSHQLQEIADAFFTNHQLANERVEVSIASTRLDRIIGDAMERVSRSLPDRATDIAAIEVDVPDGSVALADRRALVGVVVVLLENALKYGARPIRVSAEAKGGSVALLVRDGGAGIDPYHQSRIFDPFYRIDVDMRSGVGGAGLGLFTARKLVEAMHGLLRVRSVPGQGATFVVELPAGQPDAEELGDDESTQRTLRLVGGSSDDAASG
ncbi:MAG: sensor histidine kinase [Thermoleophilia bacterium]|nr:sensor histidine kinase [Thermoleophilia bacterium]